MLGRGDDELFDIRLCSMGSSGRNCRPNKKILIRRELSISGLQDERMNIVILWVIRGTTEPFDQRKNYEEIVES